jgi:hypothetical protein
MTSKWRTVQLPESLCASAEERFGPSFGSVDHLLEKLLSELLRDDALQMDKDEEQIIEQRLRELGYL